MDGDALRELVDTIGLTGWRIWVEDRYVHLDPDGLPVDNRHPGQQLTTFGDPIFVPAHWDWEMVIRRVFATLQYLIDHELREQFTVAGIRPFEAHDPPVTGYQKDWFVEHQSAVRGY